jgi:hypothetical protein
MTNDIWTHSDIVLDITQLLGIAENNLSSITLLWTMSPEWSDIDLVAARAAVRHRHCRISMRALTTTPGTAWLNRACGG